MNRNRCPKISETRTLLLHLGALVAVFYGVIVKTVGVGFDGRFDFLILGLQFLVMGDKLVEALFDKAGVAGGAPSFLLAVFYKGFAVGFAAFR